MTSRVILLGAGVSGLAAAHRLVELAVQKEKPIDLKIFEASSRPGGVIRTQARDGFLWEEGPDSFITDKPWALDLCKRLELEPELMGTNSQFQRSYVAWKGCLHPTPEGFYLLAPTRIWPFLSTSLFSWPGKGRMLLELLLPPKRVPGDESLAQFVRRRFGREALERMAQPMVAGIYSADPETLSLEATFPRFLEMEARHGSVIQGLWGRRRQRGLSQGVSGPRYSLFTTLKSGLSALVDSLVKEIPPAAFRFSSPVASLARQGDGWVVLTASGERHEADAVCIALNAPAAAEVTRDLDPVLSENLRNIPYAPSATLHLAYERADVRHPLDGFGFVVPAAEKRPFTGCTFASVKFPGRAPEGKVLLRAFLGGAGQEELLKKDEAELSELVHGHLAGLLGIQGKPLFTSLCRHARAMPQYTLGHLDRVAALETRVKDFPGLALAGNAYRGLGLPDCIRSGESAAEYLWEDLAALETRRHKKALKHKILGQ